MSAIPLGATVRACLLAVAMLGASSGVSLAGPNANAKILLHLLAPTTKGLCTRAEATPPCSSIVTAGDLYPATYFAYVLVTDADSAAGVAGVQFGIDYDGVAQSGVDIYTWTNCATLEFAEPGWPGAGTGNLVTWDTSQSCQRSEPEGSDTGVKAVVGYYYCAAYSADEFRLTTRPSDGVAKVASCVAIEDTIPAMALGSCAFSAGGGSEGDNPCLAEAPAEGRAGDDKGPEYYLARGSSGFDPLLPTITFPTTLYIPDEKALCIKGHYFGPRTTVALDYSPTARSLLVNDIQAVNWAARSRAPRAEEALPASIAWQREFSQRFSKYEATDDETRLRDVLASMDTSLLNPKWPPRLLAGYLEVLFLNDDFTSLIPLQPLPTTTPSSEYLTDAEVAETALRFAMLLIKYFNNTTEPFLLISGDSGLDLIAGPSASRAREVLSRIDVADPSIQDHQEINDLNLESAVAAIQRVRRGAGR